MWGASEKLHGTSEEVLARIRAAPVVYADETSFLVGGRPWWLWAPTTMEESLFALRESRGADVAREVLGAGFSGRVVVCEGGRAYAGRAWILQKCWAHLLRVVGAGAEESARGKKLHEALKRLYTELTEGRDRLDEGGRVRRARWGQRKLDQLVTRFGRSWARGVRKVVTYLGNGGLWWLNFVRHPGVEPTNNRAEHALREGVVIRKIVGTLRNGRGAKALAQLLSVIVTWKLRGEDPAKNLYAALS